ncbi:MAG: hypothetical protein GX433_12560 [Deltaproteobacteria bacterium]|nr:hypothetical protein [Deltaproteobacteria bacterium]
MKKMSCLLAACLVVFTLFGCGTTREQTFEDTGTPAAKNVQIRVVDVSNRTGEIFDVDVIGMLWTALNESLKKQGLLWVGDPSTTPLKMEAEIVEYQKGNFFLRYTLLPWGKTVLSVKCNIKDGDRLVATAEATRTISVTHDAMTLSAYRKIFSEVADDLIHDLTPKI